jgi:hypothetical protein
MDNKNIKNMLRTLADEPLPDDINELAEKKFKQFSEKITKQKQQNIWRIIINSKITKSATAAAIIILVFTLGFYTGRQSSQSQFQISRFNNNSYSEQFPEQSIDKQNQGGFWSRKVLTVMQRKSCSQLRSGKVNMLKIYRQYIQERHND